MLPKINLISFYEPMPVLKLSGVPFVTRWTKNETLGWILIAV